jgi:uncharacterized protein
MKNWRRAIVPLILAGVLGMSIVFLVQWFSDRNQVRVLTIATASKGGEYHRFGQALAEVIARHQPHIRLQVLETSGSRENVKLLADKKVQLAIAQDDTPLPASVQGVAALFPEAFHLLANPNSGIRSISDLKEKRIALMPKGSGSYVFFGQLLQHYGLSSKDVQAFPLSAAQGQDQLRQGKVDAWFRSIALGNPEMRQIVQETQAQLVPLDQVPALQISNPYLRPIIIPKGIYSGNPPIPAQDLPSGSVQAILLTLESVNPEIIYEITRTLYDFRYELAAINPRAAVASSEISGAALGLPLHLGASNYYNKNEPNFLQANAEPMGFLLSISLLLGSSLWQLRSRFSKRQKNRADAYNLKVLELVEQVNQCLNAQELDHIRQQLFVIFQRVVQDLDNDQLTNEAFLAFSIAWDVANNAIRHREAVLAEQSAYHR